MTEFYDGAIGMINFFFLNFQCNKFKVVTGLIQQAKADILLRAGHYFINPEIVDFSVSIKPDKYHVFQFIDSKKIERNDHLTSIFAPSTSFFLEYLFLILISFLISIFIFKRVHQKPLNFNKFLSLSVKIFFFPENFTKILTSFTIFVAWFSLFNYLIRQLLQNNIKTSAVIVDTSGKILIK